MPKRWFESDMEAYLTSLYPEFIQKQNKKQTKKFLRKVYRRWHRRYPLIPKEQFISAANGSSEIAMSLAKESREGVSQSISLMGSK